MNKYKAILKPFLPITLGAFLLLYYLNFMQTTGGTLALAIIAVVFAAFYIAYGILNIVAADKLGSGKKILDFISVVAFPLVEFTLYLVAVIQANGALSPTGWTIAIIAMVVSLGFATLYAISSFARSDILIKGTKLFGILFLLILILSTFFLLSGTPADLGDISLALTAIYVIYAIMAVPNMMQLDSAEAPEEAPETKAEREAKEEEQEPSEEPAEEEAPEEENRHAEGE
ncbi:MAG: hypothetical protein K6F32_00940 [Bacilli bacterium]|nr:hypothetical protein [Bacilli bacterium]